MALCQRPTLSGLLEKDSFVTKRIEYFRSKNLTGKIFLYSNIEQAEAEVVPSSSLVEVEVEVGVEVGVEVRFEVR